jgi:hypothetical protein
MDLNVVALTGRLISAAERAVGQTGRTLTELRLGVARPPGGAGERGLHSGTLTAAAVTAPAG